MDPAVAYHDGKAYVVGGSSGDTPYTAARVYDPASQSWHRLPLLYYGTTGARAAFIGDTLYVVGGWNSSGDTTNELRAYRLGSDDWTLLASMPAQLAASGIAVVGGKLYVIGGCTTLQCVPASKSVFSYDPSTDSWHQERDYPTRVAYASCGGVAGKIICAGGIDLTPTTTPR